MHRGSFLGVGLFILVLLGCRGAVNEPFTPRRVENPFAPLSRGALSALVLDSTIAQFFSGPHLGISYHQEGRWEDLNRPYADDSPCATTTFTYIFPATLEISEEIRGCLLSASGVTVTTRGRTIARWEGGVEGFSAWVSVFELSISYSTGERVSSEGRGFFQSRFYPGGDGGSLLYEFLWNVTDSGLGENAYEGRITAEGSFSRASGGERFPLQGYWRLRSPSEEVAGFLKGALLDYTACLLSDPALGTIPFFPLFPVGGRVELLGKSAQSSLLFSECTAILLDEQGVSLYRFDGLKPEDQRAYLQSWGGVIPGIRLYRMAGLSLYAIAFQLFRFCEGGGECYQFRYLPELDPGGTSLLRQGNVRLIRPNGDETPGGFEIWGDRLLLRFPDLGQISLYRLSFSPQDRGAIQIQLIPEGASSPVTWTASRWIPPAP
jgi:hypothetical protein